MAVVGKITMKPLYRLTTWIRDYTQDPRHQARLMSDEFSWYQLCAALDTVDDTEEAMRAYVTGEFPAANGEQYLRIYGILQALYVQQDALNDLINAVHPTSQIKVKDLLKDIRLARHRSVGHPTHTGPRGGPFSTNAIVRHTIRKEGFQLLSYPHTAHGVFQPVNLIALIEQQSEETNQILLEVIEDLRKQEAAHRSKFRDLKMKSALDQVSYAFEKIFEELRKDSIRALSAWAVGHLQRALDQFEKLLLDRGLTRDSYDSIKYLYLDIGHPLAQLRRYISDEPSEIASDPSAVVFAEALQGYFARLRVIALEIDEEYSSEPEGVSHV
jgi:hypothetical protein